MAAVANEQVRTRLERRAEVERAVAATRRADHVPELGPDDRRPAAVLREARGDEPDDPDGPRTVDQRGRCIGGALEQGTRLGDGRLHEVLPRRVGGLERLGTLRCVGRVLGQEQARRLRGLPHPPGGVEPWGDRECDRFEVHRVHCEPGTLQQCGQPGARSAPYHVEPETGDRTVLPDDRGNVGDRADRREVGQSQRRSPASRLLREDQAGELERHAAPREPAIRIDAVRPMRVHDRERIGKDGRHAMVVRHDDVEPAAARLGDLGRARRPAVDRDDQPGAGGSGGVERRQGQAVALVETARHVRQRIDPEAAERDDENRQPGQAVRVEVTEHEDSLAGIPRSHDSCQCDPCVGQQRRVVEAGLRFGKPGVELGGTGHATRGENAGHAR